MLDNLFNNPSEKLQKVLKALFVVNASFGALGSIIYEISRLVYYAQHRQPSMAALSLVLMVALPIIYVIVCYLYTLFAYTILSFFADVHDIRDELEYGVLKAYPQTEENTGGNNNENT